ncbi:MAG: hypothetical protein FWG14_12095 [Peptococcaceae bacterium]|nr:hypothetical protein [Peptococcaceae bacterium]
MNKTISPKGRSWSEVETELFSPEEIAASNLRVEIMVELTKARNERGISQRKLEELSGVERVVRTLGETGHKPNRTHDRKEYHCRLPERGASARPNIERRQRKRMKAA